jgi:hypothetical protein
MGLAGAKIIVSFRRRPESISNAHHAKKRWMPAFAGMTPGVG